MVDHYYFICESLHSLFKEKKSNWNKAQNKHLISYITMMAVLLKHLKLLYWCLKCNLKIVEGPSWSGSCGSWIYNYLSNQYLSPLTLWVQTLLRWGVLDTTLCDKVWQWFSPGTLVSSTNKSDRHDITEILLKVALNTINQTKPKIEGSQKLAVLL